MLNGRPRFKLGGISPSKNRDEGYSQITQKGTGKTKKLDVAVCMVEDSEAVGRLGAQQECEIRPER